MESLVPAFIAALLAQAGDRPPWLAAILADRTGSPGSVLAGFALAQIIGNAVAAAGGALVAATMNPHARSLLLAMALGFAAFSALRAPRIKDRLESWRIGAFAGALLGVLSTSIADRTQFIAFALAARGPDPVLAGIGAALGGIAIGFVAVMLGEEGWVALPLRAIRYAGAALLFAAALVALLAAFRVI